MYIIPQIMNTEFEAVRADGAPDEASRVSGKSFPDAPAAIEHDHAYEDYKASQALEGLPPGEIADKMEFLEKEWADWFMGGSSDMMWQTGFWSRLSSAVRGRLKLPRLDIVAFASEPLRIFRLEIRELALALAKRMNDSRALEIQADIGRAHIKNQAQQEEFCKFLQQHFETDLEMGRARQKTLFDIAKDIMLRAKG